MRGPIFQLGSGLQAASAHFSRRAAEQQRAAKRLRMLAAGIAAVALFAMVALVVAVAARRDAIRNAQLAEENADLAQKNAKRAQQNAELAQRTLDLLQLQRLA